MPAPRIEINPDTTDETLARLGIEDNEPADQRRVAPSSNGHRGAFDLMAFMQRHGLTVASVKQDQGRTIHVLAECPFDSSHKGKDAAVTVGADGQLGFHCFHNSCAGHGWRELRLKFEPDAYSRESSGHSAHLNRNDDKPALIRLPTRRAPTFRELAIAHPELREPIIHKLQRRGETLNVVAPSKVGKSWLVILLVLCIVTGRRFLDTYLPKPGKVLILDNELHGETIVDRIPRVADALGIAPEEYADLILVENLRGKLTDIYQIDRYLAQYQPGEFTAVVLDALYRFLPEGVSENDNGQMARVFNQIDYYADRLDCGFINIHHSSKGLQAGKSVVDVGAGAGSMARATDGHLVLRAHQEPGVYVLEAAVRSWAPIEPVCLRWQWPLWTLADDLDPAALKTDRPRKDSGAGDATEAKVGRFEALCRATAEKFRTEGPMTLSGLKRAMGVSGTRASELITALQESGDIEPCAMGKHIGYQAVNSEGGTDGTEN